MKILRVDSSAKTEGSASRRLADRIVSALEKKEGAVELVRRDLTAEPPPLLDGDVVTAFNTPDDQRDDAQRALLATSVALMDELRAADLLVLAAPIYNFGIPGALKAWIDLVVRARETFHYTPEGPKGLLEGKRAILAVASGGTPVGSPIDFSTPYLRHVLGFIGFEEIEIFAADGLVRGGEEKIASVEAEIDAAFEEGSGEASTADAPTVGTSA